MKRILFIGILLVIFTISCYERAPVSGVPLDYFPLQVGTNGFINGLQMMSYGLVRLPAQK